MTQPINEPLTTRSIGYGAWRTNQLERRPAPTGGGADLPYIWARWDGPQAITVNTLTNPAGAGPDYAEFFVHDPDGLAGFNFNLVTGCLDWGEPGEYFITAWAIFDGGATAGSSLGAVLDMGESCSFSTFRIGNSIITAGGGINDTFRIPVSTGSFDFLSDHDSVRVLVWHDDAGGQDCNSILIHCFQVNPSVEGDFFT